MTALADTRLLFLAVVVITGYCLGVTVSGKRHDISPTRQQASFHGLTPEEEWHIGKSSLVSQNQEGLLVLKKAMDNCEAHEMGAYVGGILAKLCDVNDLLRGGGDDSCHHHRNTSFHSIETPKVDIAEYVSRLAAQGTFPNICFILCLVYIDRLASESSDIHLYVTSLTAHRLVVAGLLVAVKFIEDGSSSKMFDEDFYKGVGKDVGLAILELKHLEHDLIQALSYNTFVTARELFEYSIGLGREEKEVVPHLPPGQ